MKKLLNLLKKGASIAVAALIIANLSITTPTDFPSDSQVSICAPTPNPDEDPLGDGDYF